MIIQYPDLKNKIVLITGATRGIGKTIAEALAIQGAHVVFNYRQGKEEIAENFPYTVIRVDGCEADDIIGTLVTMNPDHNNDFNPQKNMIVSSDRDFLQLQRFKNTRQFSPLLKKEFSS